MVKRTVVGAHYGLKDWLIQRVTAVIMVAYLAVFVLLVLPRLPISYDTWRALFQGSLFKAFTLLFLFALLYHAWIGVRDIFMDYVKPAGLRLLLHVLVVLLLILYGIWSVITLGSV